MRVNRGYLEYAGLTVLLLAGWIAYYPGLSGGFLFDDFVNLDSLGKNGAIQDWPAFWRYVTSGIADPLGRPVSLLSFLIDANNWPADPAPFLRTSLLLHLGNSALLFLLLRQLGRALPSPSADSSAIALLGAALWLLHPLWVSTTLYIVQRETILPTMFVLLGLLGYVRGRRLLGMGAETSGAIWMAAGIVLGTTLAMFSKANGVLLPLLAGVLEYSILARAFPATASASSKRHLTQLRILLLWLPLSLVLTYLFKDFLSWNDIVPDRGWSIVQRLMTEPRVLINYAWLLVTPRAISNGLYNDEFQASTGLLDPATTLLSVTILMGSIAVAWRTRKSNPAVTSAIGFFLMGHILESTSLPLELYFEHRNYLPALLLFWPIARAIVGLPFRRIAIAGIAGALLFLLAATTHSRASMWSDQQLMAQLWLKQNPNSSRARATAALAAMDADRPDIARSLLESSWRQRPLDLQFSVNYMDTACVLGDLNSEMKDRFARTIRYAPIGNELIYRWMMKSIKRAVAGECQNLNLADLENWVALARRNPAFVRSIRLDVLSGELSLARHEPIQALEFFKRQLAVTPQPEIALTQAASLASAGHFQEALDLLSYYEQLPGRMSPARPGMARIHALVLERQGYWQKEFSWMRAQLNDAIKRSPGSVD